jgi:hypothetical protein
MEYKISKKLQKIMQPWYHLKHPNPRAELKLKGSP